MKMSASFTSVPEKLGVDYETLKKINPRLIYGSGSGYGPEGPDSERPSLDGCRWIQFMSPQFARYWGDFVAALGLEHLIDDPMIITAQGMTAGSPELTAIIAERFKTKPVDERVGIFNGYKQLIFSKVQSIEEFKDDPQVIANKYITDFGHPVLGSVKMCNFPVGFSETPAGVWKEASELGQDTEAVLIDELGYDWDDIQRFQDAGTIL